MEIQGVYHFNVNCSNLERSKAFYEMLGFKTIVNMDTSLDQESSDVIWSSVGLPKGTKCKGALMSLGDSPFAARLDLIQFEDTKPEQKPYPNLLNLGICRVALWTKDFKGDVERLKAAKVEFVGEPVDRDVFFSLKKRVRRVSMCAFKDPDGTIIELVHDMVTRKPE